MFPRAYAVQLNKSSQGPFKSLNTFFDFTMCASHLQRLLDSDRLGKVAREVDVEALHDSKPVGDELKRNDVEDTLEDVNGLGDLDLESLAGLELLIVRVADDDGLATTSNDWWKRAVSILAIWERSWGFS